MKCKIEKFSPNFDGTQSLSLTLFEDFRSSYDELKEVVIDAELKKFRVRRSLNSNAYAWTLISKIADVLRSGKDEVYLKMLKRYGQSQIISVVDKGAGLFKRTVKYYEECGESLLNGKVFIHIKVFTGSSEFDTREMAIFIDGIVSEAKELGIETMPPEELEELNRRWQK